MPIEIDPLTGSPIVVPSLNTSSMSKGDEFKLPPVAPSPTSNISNMSGLKLSVQHTPIIKPLKMVPSVPSNHSTYTLIRPLLMDGLKLLVQNSGTDSMSSIKLLSSIESLLDKHLG